MSGPPPGTGPAAFPFSAVVGQEDAKLGLLLAAVDPLIGGVLLRGHKGSAKTTLARALAGLLPGDGPFVNLPLGATEDRLIGTLDLSAALVDGVVRFTPGLLAAAHRGVLYVDEVNLLADHLVDTLLDVSVSGVNRVEREGISHQHPSRFVLVGSMNPEEGELRPQLLDRFGLCVTVSTPTDVEERVAAVRRRLSFDQGEDPSADRAVDDELRARVARARPAALDDAVLDAATRLALAVEAEGLRADLVLCRAAAAAAGLDGRDRTELDDLRRVAPLVLAHRRRRGPFDPPLMDRDDLDAAISQALDPPGGAGGDDDDAGPSSDGAPGGPGSGPQRRAGDHTESDDDRGSGRGGRERSMALGAARRPPVRVSPPPSPSPRGRHVRDEPVEVGSGRPIAVAGTVRQLAARRRSEPSAGATPADLRQAVREQPAGVLLVLLVDVSGSMGATDRAEAATGTVLGLLTDAYQRRDQVALVTLGGDGARVVVEPTSSVEIARNRISQLVTGGTTPLALGITAALGVIARARTDRRAVLAVLSDGRATGGADALEDALAAARRVAAAGVPALVLDCETGPTRLGLARRLAEAMSGRHLPVSDLDPAGLTSMIRTTTKELRC